jgi:hypothetical protein
MPKTYTAAGTVSAGDVYTAAAHNIIATDVNNIIVPPAVRCTQSAAQSIPHNTSTAVAFDGADSYDTDDMHSPTVNNSRITINTDGIYAVSGTFAWNGAPTVRFHLQIAVNGSITAAYNYPIDISTGTQAVALNINTMYSFVAGNYVQLLVFQGSGGAAKNSDPGFCNFSATWIGRTA